MDAFSFDIKYINLKNGETLGYRECGNINSKNVLILIHGDLSSSLCWEPLAEKLFHLCRVIAFDLRGYGRSSYNKAISSINDLVDDLKLFTEELGIDKFSVMGWSAGGGVGLLFAARYPDLVENVILMASVGIKGITLYNFGENGQLDFTNRIKTKQEFLDSPYSALWKFYAEKNVDGLVASFNSSLCMFGGPSQEKVRKLVEEGLLQINQEVFSLYLKFNLSNESNGLVDGNGEVNNIKANILIIHGNDDPVVPKHDIEETNRILGERAKLVTFDNCGHAPLYSHEDEVIGEIKSFLKYI